MNHRGNRLFIDSGVEDRKSGICTVASQFLLFNSHSPFPPLFLSNSIEIQEMEHGDIELPPLSLDEARRRNLVEGNFEPTGNTSSLPPADRGKDAWFFLAACFMVEALVWGFPFAFGLFQEYYSIHEPFASSKNIAVIGTCAMGIMYLGAPVVFGILTKWPALRRWFTFAGLFIMCLGIGLSSLSTNVTQLILTQGIMYAIGGCVAYCPTILFVNEWFIRRRGFAFGVMWAGTGVAGVVLPLVLQYFLHAYGFRTTLRIWAITLLVLTGPLLYFVKPRLPLSQSTRQHGRGRTFDLSFLTLRTFLILQFCNILEGLGYFIPSIYLPTYAQQYLGAGSLPSAFTIIAVNVASVFGCVLMGHLIDRFHVTTCILFSTIGATLGTLLFWGFSTDLPLLYIFCITYGLFAGSFSSTYTGVIKDVQKKSDSADAGLIFAFLAAGRGIGNVVSGPLSEALVGGKPREGEAGGAYGSGYGPLIVFTGVSAACGGLSWAVRRVGWL